MEAVDPSVGEQDFPPHVDVTPRVHTVINSARVEHYGDVIEYMAKAAIDRYVTKHKRQPSPSQVAFLKKELARYTIIRKDLNTANKLDIAETDLLLETGYLPG